jgi:3-hydroxymyristoyl/3-hydroxydecanoyl-(acyl carrier protein) dehydratase
MDSVQLSPTMPDVDRTFLPTGHMRQITRVTEVAGALIVGEVELGADHWVYAEHLPDDPIFPGSLLIEAAGQLVALWAWANGQRGKPRLVRVGAEFREPVMPLTLGLVLEARVVRKRHLHFASVTIRTAEEGVEVAVVTAVLAVLGHDPAVVLLPPTDVALVQAS